MAYSKKPASVSLQQFLRMSTSGFGGVERNEKYRENEKFEEHLWLSHV